MGSNSPKTKTPRKIAREFPPLPEIDHFLTNPAGFLLFLTDSPRNVTLFVTFGHFWSLLDVPRMFHAIRGIAMG